MACFVSRFAPKQLTTPALGVRPPRPCAHVMTQHNIWAMGFVQPIGHVIKTGSKYVFALSLREPLGNPLADGVAAASPTPGPTPTVAQPTQKEREQRRRARGSVRARLADDGPSGEQLAKYGVDSASEISDEPADTDSDREVDGGGAHDSAHSAHDSGHDADDDAPVEHLRPAFVVAWSFYGLRYLAVGTTVRVEGDPEFFRLTKPLKFVNSRDYAAEVMSGLPLGNDKTAALRLTRWRASWSRNLTTAQLASDAIDEDITWKRPSVKRPLRTKTDVPLPDTDADIAAARDAAGDVDG